MKITKEKGVTVLTPEKKENYIALVDDRSVYGKKVHLGKNDKPENWEETKDIIEPKEPEIPNILI